MSGQVGQAFEVVMVVDKDYLSAGTPFGSLQLAVASVVDHRSAARTRPAAGNSEPAPFLVELHLAVD